MFIICVIDLCPTSQLPSDWVLTTVFNYSNVLKLDVFNMCDQLAELRDVAHEKNNHMYQTPKTYPKCC